MTITIEGPLKEAPRHGREGAEDWVVVLLIDAGRFGHPYEARVRCGAGPIASIASQRLAQSLRAGQMARATGGRIELVTDHGNPRFALRECVSVTVDGRECM